MKKFLCTVLVLVLAMAACVPAMAAVSPKGFNVGDTLYVQTNSGCGLNVRSQANAKSSLVCTVPYGGAVTAGNTYSGSWLYVTVQSSGKTGWISMNYLSKTKPGTKPTTTTTVKPTTTSSTSGATIKSLTFKAFKLVSNLKIVTPAPKVVGSRVNLRWIPSTESAIIMKLTAGTQLTVISEGNQWYQVKTKEGYVGFIYKAYTAVVYEGDAALYTESTTTTTAQ